MPLPDRPVANTTIDSDWGQQVHDWTFAPKGADLGTAVTTQTVSATIGHLNLDQANDDPGGWLDAANDQAVVPTGADGLYLAVLSINTVGGGAGTKTRGYLFLNGVSYAAVLTENEGGSNVTITIVTFIPLTAGDILQAWAERKESGTNPTVKVNFLRLLRVGNEYGA
jgi:hypothetical protein